MKFRFDLLALAALLAATPAAAQQAPAAEVYELNRVEVAPRPLNAAEMVAAMNASYPAALRAAGVSGTVRVSMIVGTDGVPRDARVLESADSAFNAPTLAAVQTLRFSPAELNDRPVSVRVELPIAWRIEPAAATERVYGENEVDTKPVPRNVREVQRAIERAYPPNLRSQGIEPTITVRLFVGADGVPTRTEVLRTSHAEVVEPVQALAMTLRFRPAQVGGRPVPFYLDLPIAFRVGRASGNQPE